MSSTTTTSPTPGPAAFMDGEALTTIDLARRFKRSPQTIRAFVKHEGLPVHRIRGRMYFLPDEVEQWIAARSGAATAGPTDPAREHRDHIKKLVDEAPPLTAEQVAVIRRVLTGGAA